MFKLGRIIVDYNKVAKYINTLTARAKTPSS